MVLDNFSIELHEKCITSIIGPNGSGKSTFLEIISKSTQPSGGSVTIDDLELATTSANILSHIIATLRQENNIDIRLQVKDLVAFGRYPYTQGRLTIVDKEHIERSLSYLNILHLKDCFIDELSGGQRQRVFIAMIICQDTKYILLDEPLNSLDLRHAADTMKLLRKAVDELGKTIIMVIHDINFATYYSDRVIAIKDGHILFEGTNDEVLNNSNLSELYDMTIKTHVIEGRKVITFYE
ncbi:TPA: ATP-binding cassette domain-containing protein [Citrobacter amalonaticus]|nr:ATP-binding cassette domain-containing protein [Citrobacter amalonaticus]